MVEHTDYEEDDCQDDSFEDSPDDYSAGYSSFEIGSDPEDDESDNVELRRGREDAEDDMRDRAKAKALRGES